MPSRIAVVQHGEKSPGPGDPGLTDAGRLQALRAASALRSEHPAAIVSSPLRRARETAQPLSDATFIRVRLEPRLRERLNLAAGTELGAFAAAWQRSTTDRAWTPPGGRSSDATALDMLAVLSEVARDGALVVLFSHGGATVDLLRTILGDDELSRRQPHLIEEGPAPGAITRVERRTGGVWEVTGIADTAPAQRD